MQAPHRIYYLTRHLLAITCIAALGPVARGQDVASVPLAPLDEGAILPVSVELSSANHEEPDNGPEIRRALFDDAEVMMVGTAAVKQIADRERFLRVDQMDVQFANWQTDEERRAQLVAEEMRALEGRGEVVRPQFDREQEVGGSPRTVREVVEGLRLSYVMAPAEDQAPAAEVEGPDGDQAEPPSFDLDFDFEFEPISLRTSDAFSGQTVGSTGYAAEARAARREAEALKPPADVEERIQSYHEEIGGRPPFTKPEPTHNPSESHEDTLSDQQRQQIEQNQREQAEEPEQAGVFLTGDPSIDPPRFIPRDDLGNHGAGEVAAPVAAMPKLLSFGEIAATAGAEAGLERRGDSQQLPPHAVLSPDLQVPTTSPHADGQAPAGESAQQEPSNPNHPEPENQPESEPDQPVTTNPDALLADASTQRGLPLPDARNEPIATHTTSVTPAPEAQSSPAPAPTAPALAQPEEVEPAQLDAPIDTKPAPNKAPDLADETEASAQPVTPPPLPALQTAHAVAQESDPAPELSRAAEFASMPIVAPPRSTARLVRTLTHTADASTVFAAVPEPQSALALVLLAPMLMVRRRR